MADRLQDVTKLELLNHYLFSMDICTERRAVRLQRRKNGFSRSHYNFKYPNKWKKAVLWLRDSHWSLHWGGELICPASGRLCFDLFFGGKLFCIDYKYGVTYQHVARQVDTYIYNFMRCMSCQRVFNSVLCIVFVVIVYSNILCNCS